MLRVAGNDLIPCSNSGLYKLQDRVSSKAALHDGSQLRHLLAGCIQAAAHLVDKLPIDASD